MKKLILLLSIVLIASTSKAQDATFNNLPPDKQKHLIAGATISGTAFWFSQAVWNDENTSLRVALGLGATAAFFKEEFDALNGKRFSWEDAGYTFTASVVTTLTSYAIVKVTKWIKKKKTNNKKELIDFDELPLTTRN